MGFKNIMRGRVRTAAAYGAALLILALVGTHPVLAEDSGPTTTGQICMQKVFGTPVVNSNTLVCTANDIRIARATHVNPGSCIEGTTFTLEATFEINVTANSRYDSGFFFRIDGGTNARGDGNNAVGQCSLSALTPGVAPAQNLDGDTCGDLNAATYAVTFTIPGVQCIGVPHPTDSTKKILRLPNCTSWHSNQGTSCNIDNPLDFDPDTKSKCVCDDNFTVPVFVEAAQLRVVKTASPITMPEPGGQVTYNVQVTNQASIVSVTLKTINDDIYGDLHVANPNVTDNTCPSLVNTVLGPGASASCSFKAMVSGNVGQKITDVVEVCGDQPGIPDPTQVCGNDDADVTITDVTSTPTLAKTVVGAACTVDVTYQVVVNNNSAVDTLTVNSLIDDTFGDITQVQGNIISTNCASGGTIAAGGNYSCTFDVRIDTGTGPCNIDHTNKVTGSVTDDDGVTTTPSDTATIKVETTFP